MDTWYKISELDNEICRLVRSTDGCFSLKQLYNEILKMKPMTFIRDICINIPIKPKLRIN